MNKNIYLILTGIIILTSSFYQCAAQVNELIRERRSSVMERMNFENWKSEDALVTAGVDISQSMISQLSGLSEVWDQPNVDIESIDNVLYSEIRKWWRTGEDELEVLMVVGPTFDDAKEYLLRRYIETQAPDDFVNTPGEEFGLTVGDVRFVTVNEENREGFSTIDFIRRNVVIMLRAEGTLQNQLREIAETLDAHLLENIRTATLNEQPEVPSINAFSPRQSSHVYGEEIILDLDIYNSKELRLHYFWDLTDGGVRKDMLDNFVYQAGKKGKQLVDLTVVNDIGLYDSTRVDIVVE